MTDATETRTDKAPRSRLWVNWLLALSTILGAGLVQLFAMGAVMTEALAAADRLEQAGVSADVVCVTSPGLLFEAWQARQGHGCADTWILDQLFPARRANPIVTVLDGHPHTLAFLANIQRVPLTALGVSKFGQVGDLQDVYRYHGIDTDSIVRAALDVIE